MKIYTKTGDEGETGLFGGPRVFKDDARIEAYGTLDELNAVLGCVRAFPAAEPIQAWLTGIQNDLFTIGAELATPNAARQRTPTLPEERVAGLEALIDRLDAELPPLRNFILPGGSRLGALVHLGRVVARRAERRVVSLRRLEPAAVSAVLLRYLNRLSDFLFVLARHCNVAEAAPEEPWQKPERSTE